MSHSGVILVVEDGEDDILILTQAFRAAGILNPVMTVRNGQEAIWYLEGGANYWSRTEFPLPRLILLDLKMPGIDGFEVLAWIKRRKEFAGIAVVVLTGSNDLKDVQRAYDLGANSFIVKEAEFRQTVRLCSLLQDYWMGVNRAYSVQTRARKVERA